jgi:hypothetical protein
MDIAEYQQKVIELFQSGTATQLQWEEMAYAVLMASESDDGSTAQIDQVIEPY